MIPPKVHASALCTVHIQYTYVYVYSICVLHVVRHSVFHVASMCLISLGWLKKRAMDHFNMYMRSYSGASSDEHVVPLFKYSPYLEYHPFFLAQFMLLGGDNRESDAASTDQSHH